VNNETKKPDADVVRVLRGGSWNYNAWYVRSADRVRFEPSSRNANTGFRLVSGADLNRVQRCGIKEC
jgi:formylglycine-generating enzyme required for sulfatase activity